MGRILVTGSAGFIGNAVSLRLLSDGHEVVGVDNLNDYYDPSLKLARLARLEGEARFQRIDLDLADTTAVERLFADHRFDSVVHLAAQAGVRYSLQNPHAYAQSNLVGFLTILEGCRHAEVAHVVYASSSSVYGLNQKMPFSTHAGADHPASLYAATKKANEAMAHSYSHLYRLPATGLRFFTVYGPWGRPDMSPILFASAISEGRPIQVFNHGNMERDFTYIDDIVEGVVRILAQPAQPDADFNPESPDPSRSSAPHRVFNIGNSEPVPLLRFIELLEQNLGRPAKRELLPMQPGDVRSTFADVLDLERAIGYRPQVSIEEGVARFVDWFKVYYGLPK